MPSPTVLPSVPSSRWTNCLLPAADDALPSASSPLVIGAIPGEGIGPEVVGSALEVLRAVVAASNHTLDIRLGGPIGRDAERLSGNPLPQSTIDFCGDIFASGGAVLCGPGGGRFVYDLRKAFDLFFKISPLRMANGLPEASRLKSEGLHGVDILLVRENSEGLYQGQWSETASGAAHSFHYSETSVRRFLIAAARLARSRSGHLTVVWKESGVPSISLLWKRCAEEICDAEGIRHTLVDIDLMSYQLISQPQSLDVIASPNLFGDVLGDLGAVLLGSRGLSFSGNYDADRHAVYQTNHGAAYDLAGKAIANPAGQIFSAAMMLRESFGLVREADAIEQAVRSVWQQGSITQDLASSPGRIIDTHEMADLIARQAASLLQSAQIPA